MPRRQAWASVLSALIVGLNLSILNRHQASRVWGCHFSSFIWPQLLHLPNWGKRTWCSIKGISDSSETFTQPVAEEPIQGPGPGCTPSSTPSAHTLGSWLWRIASWHLFRFSLIHLSSPRGLQTLQGRMGNCACLICTNKEAQTQRVIHF